MRVGVRVAFDVGSVRIGVARSDAQAALCVPVATIATIDEAVSILDEYDPLEIIVGLPVSMDGTEQRAAARARAWATKLSERTNTPIRLMDERLSTTSAGRDLATAGLSTRQARNVVDQAAAVIILEHALETERRTGSPGGTQL